MLGFGIEFAAILVRDKSLDITAPSGVVPGTTAATLPSESPVAAGITPPVAPAAPAYKRL